MNTGGQKMRKYKSLIAVLIAIISIFCFSTNVFAATAEKYGLQATVTTNKASYTENEDIEIKVVVTNENNYAVSDIALEALLPDGLKLKDNNAPLTNQIDVLKAGETIKLELVAVYDSEYATGDTDNETSSNETPVGNNSSSTTKPAQTGDTIGILLIMLAIAVVAVIVMIIAIKHQKKAMKFFALILCVGISVPFLNTIVSNAAERSFTVTEPITVEDNTFEFQVKVYYGEKVIVEDTRIGLKIDQSDFTTTKIHEKLSGSFNSDKNVKAVTYINRYDYETNEETDFEQEEANIEGNTWSIPDILLRPGNNVISITAITTDNTKETKEINVNYDDGIDYTPDFSHAVYPNGRENAGYIDNMIFIMFEPETTEEEKREIVSSIDGTVISQTNSLNEYDVQIEPTDLIGLRNICSELNKNPNVFMAKYDIVETDWYFYHEKQLSIQERFANETSNIDNYWRNNFNDFTEINWDEENPSGYNWYLEAIQAPSAWDYNNRFNKISIGVVDNGFDTEHEDLDIHVLNPEKNNKQDHGTRVAGIIGATSNNDIGVTGIVWNKNLFGYSLNASEGISQENKLKGIAKCIAKGCKIVNNSTGVSTSLSNEDDIFNHGYMASAFILYVKQNIRSDFLIVKSAGNEKNNAITDGTFASITPETVQKMLEDKKEYTVTVDDIMDRFMVVGGTDKNTKDYKLTSFSNYGSQVSVVAPGVEIYNTVVTGGLDGNYSADKGTSFSAPIVSGVAGLVWSVNEDFSPGTVKDIVCNSTKDTVKPYHKEDTTPVYHMVNAKLAVEKAIALTDNKIGQVGGTVLDEQGNPLENVTVTLKPSNNTGSSYETITNENGAFNFENVTEGTYNIIYHRTDCRDNTDNTIKITKDVMTVILDPVTLSKLVVQGKVTDLMGNPLPDVSIDIYKEHEEYEDEEGKDTFIGTVTSNSDGIYSYKFEHGYYKLIYHKENFGEKVIPNIAVSSSVYEFPSVSMGSTLFEIWTTEHFRFMEENPTGEYILMADLDLTDSPRISSFNGTFIGNGHTVTVPYDNTKGLFKELEKDANIQGLTINIQSAPDAKLSVVNTSYGPGIMYGAVCLINYGTIKDCITNGAIIDNTLNDGENAFSLGGLVAYSSLYKGAEYTGHGDIIHCRNNATIEIKGNTIIDGESYAPLWGSRGNSTVGGIVGSSSGKIEKCLNTGNITVNYCDFIDNKGNIIASLYISVAGISCSRDPMECGNTGIIKIKHKDFIGLTIDDNMEKAGLIHDREKWITSQHSFTTSDAYAYQEWIDNKNNVYNLTWKPSDTNYTIKTNEEIETWWNETYSK